VTFDPRMRTGMCIRLIITKFSISHNLLLQMNLKSKQQNVPLHTSDFSVLLVRQHNTNLVLCVIVIVTLFLLRTKLSPQLTNGCTHLTHSHAGIASFHFVPHLSIHLTLSCKQHKKTKRKCKQAAIISCSGITTEISCNV